MSDRTNFTLSVLDKHIPKLMTSLDDIQKEFINDIDDSTLTHIVGSINVKDFCFWDRRGGEFDPLLIFISKLGIPATLSIDGIDEFEPENVHARIDTSGEMNITRTHPAQEGMIEHEKVLQAYALGQVDMLIRDMEKSNYTWELQVKILQDLGIL